MQIQDNTLMYYRRGNRSIRQKTSLLPFKWKIDPLENNLEYMNNKRPSKLLLPTDFTKPCLL